MGLDLYGSGRDQHLGGEQGKSEQGGQDRGGDAGSGGIMPVAHFGEEAFGVAFGFIWRFVMVVIKHYSIIAD